MTKSKKPELPKVHCNRCGIDTEHTVAHEEDRSVSEQIDKDTVVTAYSWYRLITCNGCKSVSMEHMRGHSEDWDPETGPSYSMEYFPPRTFRRAPQWLSDGKIPEYIRRSLEDLYVALQNKLNVLAGIGIRALLESLMVKTVGDKGRFAENLKALGSAGHVSRGQYELLESTLEIGHAAMHRNFVPPDEALVACMDVTEHVIQSIYVFPRLSASLKKNVPKRPAHQSPKPKPS